jgi:hypothetical protein
LVRCPRVAASARRVSQGLVTQGTGTRVALSSPRL